MAIDPETKEVITRLEGKVDGLIQGFERLTRIEERLGSFIRTMERHERWLTDHEKRIREAAESTILQRAGIDSNKKFVWWFMTLGGSFVAGFFAKFLATGFGG